MHLNRNRFKLFGMSIEAMDILLFTWVSFNSSIMDYIHNKVLDEIIHPIPIFNDTTIEVWKSNDIFFPYFTGYMFTYPCWIMVFHP